MEICLAERIDIKLASVPQGKDPCDFVSARGGQAFKELIENATDVMQYRWEKLAAKFGSSENLTDRRAATEEFLRSVAAASKGGTLDAITHGLIINRLSRILQIPAEDIRKELARRSGPSRQAVINTIENAKVSSVELGSGFGAKAQTEVIEVLLNEPRLFESAARKLKAADFDVQVLREIWLLIEQASAGGTEYSLVDLLAQTESKDVSSLMVKLSDNGQDVETLRKRLNGAMEAMDEYRNKKGQADKKTDDSEMLKRISDIKAKPDRRNPGLMPI
jgi:DNA primase